MEDSLHHLQQLLQAKTISYLDRSRIDFKEYDKFIGYVGAAAGLNGVTDPALINEVVAVLESLRAPIVQE